MHRWLILLLSLTCLRVSAEDYYELVPMGGVKIGPIKYVNSESKRDPKIEAALVKVLDLKEGEEVRYIYNRIPLGPGGKQVFVMLVGPSFSGSGGSTAVILNQVGAEYRKVAGFTLVHNPILVGSSASHGWKDLIWQVGGGGVKTHYATLHFNGKSYPSNPSSVPDTPPGSTLKGTAYMSESLSPEKGLRFTVGQE